MGRASNAKKNRTPEPYTRPSLWSYLPDGSTALFVIAVFVLSYGTTAMQYSRWNHAENARVHPIFHPWAIIAGIILLFISIKKTRKP